MLEAESVGAMQLAASQPVVSSGNSARGSDAYPCVTDPYYVPMMCRGFNSGQMSLQCKEREREIKSNPDARGIEAKKYHHLSYLV